MVRLSIILTLVLTSCGPINKLQRAEKLIAQAIAKGAEVDSTKYMRYDTLRVPPLNDAMSMNLQVNPVFIIEECEKLLQAPPRKHQSIAKNIQDKICPEISIDTTYTLRLRNKEGLYTLPIHVKVHTLGGKVHYSIEGKELIVPIKTEETSVKVSAGFSVWQMIVLAVVCLLAGYGLRSIIFIIQKIYRI